MKLPEWLCRKRVVIDDVVFGHLTYDRKLHSWRGELQFEPASMKVIVGVDCDEAGPTQDHHDGFEVLKRRYAGLIPALSAMLYKAYTPTSDFAKEGIPYPRSAAEMWSMVRLIGIDIQSADTVGLLFNFVQGIGWDDLCFTVKLKNWRIEEVQVGD